MKAIVNTARGKLKLLEQPIPQPGSGWVRIRTRFVGICTTDLKMIGGWERTGYPAIPGHEWSGVVDAVGPGVNPALKGRLCVAENVLSSGGEVGFEHPGAYAEYFLTRAEKLYPLPDNFPAHLAALIEPLAVCLHALDRLNPSKESPVLIFGDGPIGLLMLAVLHWRGHRELAMVGLLPNRLALARELGAHLVVDYHTLEHSDTPALPREYSNIIEASGSPAALERAIRIAPHGGRILFMGDYETAHSTISWNDLLHREIELIGSNASAGAWLSAVRLVLDGHLPLEKVITHRFPFNRFVEAIETTGLHKDLCIKVMLDWGG